jgi:hypothetical protein
VYFAYDSDRKKFAFLAGNGLGRYYMPGWKQMDEGLTLLEEQMKGKKKPAFSPWYYDVASGQFERSPATGSMGGDAGAFPRLHYLSANKQFFVVGSKGVAIFDPARAEWTDAKPKVQRPRATMAAVVTTPSGTASIATMAMVEMGRASWPTRSRAITGSS